MFSFIYLIIYLCVGVCMICGGGSKVHVWRSGFNSRCLSSPSILLETVSSLLFSFLFGEFSCFCLSFAIDVLGLQEHTTMLDFLFFFLLNVGYGDTNSGLHAYKAKTSPTKPSPMPVVF